MACRSGCLTQDHSSWGACARSSDLQWDLHGIAGYRLAEKQKDSRLTAYADARKAGIQPATTQLKDIRRANEDGGVPQRSTFKMPGS